MNLNYKQLEDRMSKLEIGNLNKSSRAIEDGQLTLVDDGLYTISANRLILNPLNKSDTPSSYISKIFTGICSIEDTYFCSTTGRGETKEDKRRLFDPKCIEELQKFCLIKFPQLVKNDAEGEKDETWKTKVIGAVKRKLTTLSCFFKQVKINCQLNKEDPINLAADEVNLPRFELKGFKQLNELMNEPKEFMNQLDIKYFDAIIDVDLDKKKLIFKKIEILPEQALVLNDEDVLEDEAEDVEDEDEDVENDEEDVEDDDDDE